MESDEGIYHATPLTRGRVAHASIDNKTYSTRRTDIMALPVCSEALKLIGKIDLYKQDKKLLVERKFQLKQIYRGQYYQLWAQYFCMREMGYKVEHLAFYEILTNRMIPVPLPNEEVTTELKNFIQRFREYSLDAPIIVNINKCAHCIYCNLCDKADTDNVYT